LNRLRPQTPNATDCGLSKEGPRGALCAWLNRNIESNQAMTKSLEIISEAVSNPKHPFRKVDNQPKKPQKHRYERRKIREYLHLGEWVTGEAT
jgi:hypothetical protein